MPCDAPETPETPATTPETPVTTPGVQEAREAAAAAPPEAEAAEVPAEEGAARGGDGGELPSVGSASHAQGNCKPCAFLHTKGCDNGLQCPFCHLCELGEKKKRRKERMRRAAEVREEATGAAEFQWLQQQPPLLLATTCPAPPQAMAPELTQELERAHAERAAVAFPPLALLPPVPPSWSAWEAPGAPGLAPPGLAGVPPDLYLQQLAFEQQVAWAWAQEAALAANAAQLPPPPAAAPGLEFGAPQGLLHAAVEAAWASPEKVMSPAMDEGPPTPFDKLVSMVEAGGAREANPSASSPQPLGRLAEAVTPPRPTRRAQGARGGRRGRGETAREDENQPPPSNAEAKGAD